MHEEGELRTNTVVHPILAVRKLLLARSSLFLPLVPFGIPAMLYRAESSLHKVAADVPSQALLLARNPNFHQLLTF